MRITKLNRFPILMGVLLLVAGLSGCNKEDEERRYCDSSGCYACRGDRCYPVPGDPTRPDPGKVTVCDNDSACGAGRVCNLGRCEQSCADDTNCANGNTCVSGRCRPAGAAACGIAGALCTEDRQCGASRTCVAKACASACKEGACALGQVCANGACIDDPAPKMAQCTFDFDCHAGQGGLRCINAYCLPTCADSKACGGGSACVKGVCRADKRPS